MHLKNVLVLFVLVTMMNLLTISHTTCQKAGQELVDSLIAELPKAVSDTSRINLLNKISGAYKRVNPQKGVEYGEQGALLAEQINWTKGRAITLNNIGINTLFLNDFQKAIPILIEAYDFAEQCQHIPTMAQSALMAGYAYEILGQNESSMKYYIKCVGPYRKIDSTVTLPLALSNTANMYNETGRHPEALSLTAELIELSKKYNLQSWLASAYRIQGSAYLSLSNYPFAQQSFFEALRISEQSNERDGMQNSYLNIGVIYQTQEDYDKALEYYNKALILSKDLGKTESTALILTNIGSVYHLLNKSEEARSYYTQALELYEGLESTKYVSMMVYNIGGIYLAERNYGSALESFERALSGSLEANNHFQAAVISGLIGSTYHQIGINEDSTLLAQYFNNNNITAIETGLAYTDSAITHLTDQGELKNRAFYLQQKSIIEADLGRYADALSSYQQYTQINDSLFNIERDKKLVQAEMKYAFGSREDSITLENTKQQLALQNEIKLQTLTYTYDKKEAAAKSEREKEQLAYEEALKRQEIENDFAKKQAEAEALMQQGALERKQAEALNQAELRRQRSFRNFTLLGTTGLLIFSIVVFRQRNKVKKEKARSEALLLNILPAEVAAELKEKGRTDAKDFDMVSILFSDFKSFTEKSAKLSAQELVSEIHICFEAFDGIMEQYHIEKIKTIGDSYMAAGGLLSGKEDSVKNTVLATLKMQSFISKRKLELTAKGLPAFEMRVGVHTGPVVAGIVGIKKFQYDLWGDTVNTASRMESQGEINKVNVSQSTYEFLKDDPQFTFENRGKIEAKGIGEIGMYFVTLNA